jgi:hypothetical protein
MPGYDEGLASPLAIVPGSGNARGVHPAPAEQPRAEHARLGRKPGVRRTGGQAAHPRTRAEAFLGQGLGERQHVCLRRAVHGLVGAGLERGGRGNIQDRSAAAFQHAGQQQGHQLGERRHVDFDDLQLPLGADFGDGAVGSKKKPALFTRTSTSVCRNKSAEARASVCEGGGIPRVCRWA